MLRWLGIFIIVFILNAIFVLSDKLNWIIELPLICGILFAVPIYKLIYEKGFMLVILSIASIYLGISYIIDYNLIPQDIMILQENLLFGSVYSVIAIFVDMAKFLDEKVGKPPKTKNITEKHSEIDTDEALRLYELEKLYQECEEIENKIQKLHCQRDEIRTGGWLDNIGYDKPMSREEESRNRRLYDEISSKIRSLEFQREEKERQIRLLRK